MDILCNALNNTITPDVCNYCWEWKCSSEDEHSNCTDLEDHFSLAYVINLAYNVARTLSVSGGL